MRVYQKLMRIGSRIFAPIPVNVTIVRIMAETRIPTRIYFDSNMLRGWPESPYDVWNLFSLAKWLKSEICLPAVVERELEAQRLRATSQDVTEINRRIRSMGKRGQRISNFEHGLDEQTEQTLTNFRQLSETIKNHFSIKTVPLPVVDLETLVDMAIHRKVPFEEINLDKTRHTVTGFADTMILFSIIQDIQNRPDKDGRYVFVTADSVFYKPEITGLLASQNVKLQFRKSVSSVWDELKPFLVKAFRDPWVQEMKSVENALNASKDDLSLDVFEFLFASTTIDQLWPNATELDDFQLIRFVSAETDLPDDKHLPPTVEVYERPEGSVVKISARAEITMKGISVVPNYLSGVFAAETDDQGRRLFHATIDVSLAGTVTNGTITGFQVEGVSR